MINVKDVLVSVVSAAIGVGVGFKIFPERQPVPSNEVIRAEIEYELGEWMDDELDCKIEMSNKEPSYYVGKANCTGRTVNIVSAPFQLVYNNDEDYVWTLNTLIFKELYEDESNNKRTNKLCVGSY